MLLFWSLSFARLLIEIKNNLIIICLCSFLEAVRFGEEIHRLREVMAAKARELACSEQAKSKLSARFDAQAKKLASSEQAKTKLENDLFYERKEAKRLRALNAGLLSQLECMRARAPQAKPPPPPVCKGLTPGEKKFQKAVAGLLG